MSWGNLHQGYCLHHICILYCLFRSSEVISIKVSHFSLLLWCHRFPRLGGLLVCWYGARLPINGSRIRSLQPEEIHLGLYWTAVPIVQEPRPQKLSLDGPKRLMANFGTIWWRRLWSFRIEVVYIKVYVKFFFYLRFHGNRLAKT